MTAFLNAFDGPIQTIVSVIALVLWTYLVVVARQRQFMAVAIWVVAALFAISSLHYVDVVGTEVARLAAFLLRLALVTAAVMVIVSVHRRRREPRPWT